MTQEERSVRVISRRVLEKNYNYLQHLVGQKNITDPKAARIAILNWLTEQIGNDPEIIKMEQELREPTRIWQWAGSEISDFVKILDLTPKEEAKPRGDMVHLRKMDHLDIQNHQDIKAYLFQQIDDYISRNQIYRLTAPTREAIRQICLQELKDMSVSIPDLPRILTEDEWDEFTEETLYKYERKMP